MALGYRGILTTDSSPENLKAILRVLRGWITKRKRFSTLPMEDATLFNTQGSRLTSSQIGSIESGAYRWVLTEEWDAPAWYSNASTSRTGTTHITLIFDHDVLWLWVDVEPPTLSLVGLRGDLRTEPQYSGTPAFVSDIIANVIMNDGLAEPLPNFSLVATPAHINELLSIAEDSQRIGSVYITATPRDRDPNDWKEKASDLIGAIQGMGTGYVLTPEMTATFNAQVAPGHYIPAGGIRTYLPGADLSDPLDSFNHKLLHPRTLIESDERRIRRIIRNAQLDRLNDIRLPDVLREADYEFLRLERLRPFEVLHAASSSPDEPSAENVANLRARLKDAEAMTNEALDENRRYATSASEARAEVKLLRLDFEDAYSASARYQVENEQIRRELQKLRSELAAQGAEGAALAWAPEEAVTTDSYPETFEELCNRLSELPGVTFCGDIEDTKALDEHATLGQSVVMKAWDALVTFNSYAQARTAGAFDQSLSHYVTHAQHGLPMRISNVKWSEGETVQTNKKMSGQRTVSGVSPKIAKTGELVMLKHIPLATGRANSPRLYFEDTYSAISGVLVGYLGGHLDNTQTN
jgi:hypothetical protein